MDVVGEGLHVGKTPVGIDVALGVARRAAKLGSVDPGFTVQQSSMFTYG